MAKKTFSDVVLRVDTPDVNGNIYPRETLEKAVEEAQGKIENGGLFGTLDVSAPKVRLGDVSHRVTSLKVEGDEVRATVVALDTEQGKILQEILRQGTPRLSPVGYGNRDDGMRVTSYSITSIHVDCDLNGE